MRFAFVLEQTLGHGAHSRNLKRALEAESWIEPAIVELEFNKAAAALRPFPLLSNWSLRSSIATRRGLGRARRNRPLDAIFVHTQVASLLSVGLLKRVPSIVSLDATPKNFDLVGWGYGHRTHGRAAEAVKTALNKRVFRAAAQIVTWNRWAAESLTLDYGIDSSKIHVIAPGVDLEMFRPRARPRKPGPVRVLFVGGDFVRKGGADLLSAMETVDGAELDIVTGANTVDAARGVTFRVHRGLTPQSPALLDLYLEADIFALPSRSDCLPQALAEAAASGLPIVATRSGAIPELVQNGWNGYLVRESSPRDLAHAIRRLVHSPEQRELFGINGRQLAEREHDAGKNNRQIFALLKQAAADTKGVRSLMTGQGLERA